MLYCVNFHFIQKIYQLKYLSISYAYSDRVRLQEEKSKSKNSVLLYLKKENNAVSSLHWGMKRYYAETKFDKLFFPAVIDNIPKIFIFLFF